MDLSQQHPPNPPTQTPQERQSKRQAVEGAGHGADLMDTGRTQSPER